MTPDQERWAEALQVERVHGDNAYVFVAARVGECAVSGDMDGVDRWTEIAMRLGELREARRQPAN